MVNKNLHLKISEVIKHKERQGGKGGAQQWLRSLSENDQKMLAIVWFKPWFIDASAPIALPLKESRPYTIMI